jgi:hypothetical protein
VDKVVGAFKALGPIVGKVASFIGRVVTTYVGVYVKAFQLSLKVVQAVWHGIGDVVGTVVGTIRDKADDLRDKLTGAWRTIRDKGTDAFHALTAPIQVIVDLVDGLLDKISKIHVPHVGNPFGAGMDLSGTSSRTAGSDQGQVNLSLNVSIPPGSTPAQANGTAQVMMDAIDDRLRSVGRKPVFAR